MDIPVLVSPRPGTTLEAALDAIHELVLQHDVLRTVVEDRHGGFGQRVVGETEVPVLMVECDAPLPSSALWDLLTVRDDGPRLAFAVLLVGGQVHLVVLRLEHTLSDEWGAALLKADLDERLGGAAPGPARPDRSSSLDVVHFEDSAEGERLAARTERYLTAELTDADAGLFTDPSPAPPEQPRYWDARLQSTSLAGSVLALSSRWRTSAAAPFVTAFAAALAVHHEQRSALVFVTSSNRAPRRWRTFAGPMAQDVPLHVRFGTSSLGTDMLGVRDRLTDTLALGHHDPLVLERVTRSVEQRRGLRLDRPPWTAGINVHVLKAPAAGGGRLHPVSGAAGRAEPVETLVVAPRSAVESCGAFLNVSLGRRRCDLAVHFDTAFLGVVEMAAVLRGIETILTVLASGDTTFDDLAAGPLVPLRSARP